MKNIKPIDLVRMEVDLDFIVSITSKLVRINSENPPGREEEIASFVSERLAELGFKAFVDKFRGRANAVGVYRRGSGPRLLLVTHLDTVPAGRRENWSFPPFDGVTANGRIYGRGAVDAKGPLASMLGAVKVLADSGWEMRGELVLAAVADGEGDLEGVKRLLARGVNADSAIIGEPTGLRVCIAQRGRLLLSVTFLGRSSHAGLPNLGANALQAVSEFVLKLHEFPREFSESHPLLGPPSLAPTIITGGSGDSVIPDHVEVLVDRRVLPNEKIDSVVESLARLAGKIGNRLNAKTEVKVKRWIPPAETQPDAEIVRKALKAVSEVVGTRSEPAGYQGTCGMSFLVNEERIPSVIFGPGDLRRAHAADEWVSLAELETAAKVYYRMISSLLGLGT